MNKIEMKRIQQRKEAGQAVRVLKKEIANIRDVKDWAELVKCSKTKLNQLMKVRFGVTTKTMLKNTRLVARKKIIEGFPDLNSYVVGD